MAIWRNFTEFWSNSNSTAEFQRAQYAVLARQIPLMYVILVINMATLSYMHTGRAPDYLTVVIPGILIFMSLFRAISVARGNVRMPPDSELAGHFRTTLIVSIVLGGAITAWSLLLFGYGDAYSKGQVTFFTGVSIIAIVACLMPLRQMPAIMTAVVVAPTCIFLLFQDQAAFHAIAVNLILVIGTLVVLQRRAYTNFRARIAGQEEVDSQRRQLQSLHDTVSLLANQDSLTGLPNRRSFFDGLDRLIDSENGDVVPFAVGIIDIDGFKPVNDILGHAAGDKMLTEVARRLSSAIPYGATIARLGGDEFAIILPCPGTEQEILATSRDILATLMPAFQLDEGISNISASCGLACYPDAGRSGEELFERADFALYHAKANGRGAATIFSADHETEIKRNATISQRLRETDLDAALYLEYQPIVACHNGRTLGLEALARWTDPVLGRVPPDIFIRNAEQCGMIGPVTLALFGKALRAAARWPEHLYLSFNLSAHDLCSTETMSAILAEIDATGFPIGRLVFEITESAIMQDFDRAILALNALRDAGAAIALDDFGTGYSSLSYVRRLPIDRIKVDRAFILDLEKEQVARDILKTISDLCRNLRLQCIIEGVETHSQLAILAGMGGSAYQGYLFARPMTEDRVIGYLEAETGRLLAG